MAKNGKEPHETASVNTRLMLSTTNKLRYIKEQYGTRQAIFVKQAVDEKIKKDKLKIPSTL